MGKPDRIEREVLIPVPPERVWMALTVASELAAWFGDSASIDLRPGGAARFGWSVFDDASIEAVVEVVEPPHRFGFCWQAGDAPLGGGQDTHVEFTLDAVEGGTLLRLVESGFASLPDWVYDKAMRENTSGWTEELAELVAHVAVSVA